jgi:ParB family chromosome partitioning protein
VNIKKVSIERIAVGQRHRKHMGDLTALSCSINALGLLQPIGITSTMRLVWGERRLKACQMLGWEEIDAVVDPSLDDILRAMQAESDENACRLEFSTSERVAIADNIEGIEQERARERQRTAQRASAEETNRKLGRTAPKETVGEESAATVATSGETRQKVAAAVGLSHDTLTKARKVVAEGTPELVEAMDSGTASVHAAAEIAALPPAKQRAVVAGGRDAIASAAAKLRTPRRPGLVKAVERLEFLAGMDSFKLSIIALREAVADLRKELGSLLS